VLVENIQQLLIKINNPNTEPEYSLTKTCYGQAADVCVSRQNQLRKEKPMKVLIIFNREPYDNTDVTWNGLRLAGKLSETGQEVRIFLMNDSVDMARDVCKPPEGYDQDLSQMLKDLIAQGVPVKVCGTCMARCGIYKNHPYFEGAEKSTMPELAEWVVDSDKVITF
jgi:uncharacterized protein involved in oxidation of intracellular sulfur